MENERLLGKILEELRGIKMILQIVNKNKLDEVFGSDDKKVRN